MLPRITPRRGSSVRHEESVTKRGFLGKRAGFFGMICRRFVVLENAALSIFCLPSDRTPNIVIPLRGASILESDDLINTPYSIAVFPSSSPTDQKNLYPGAPIWLVAESSAERDEWICALRAVAADWHDEREIHQILESVFESIVLSDWDGLILGFNPAAEQMFGWCPSEIIGNNISILMPDHCAKIHQDIVQDYRETGRRRYDGKPLNISGLRKCGQLFPVEMKIGELPDNDLDASFIVVFRDASSSSHLHPHSAPSSPTLWLAEHKRQVEDLLNAHDAAKQSLLWSQNSSENDLFSDEQAWKKHSAPALDALSDRDESMSDDLTTDSDGNDEIRAHLGQFRKNIDALVQISENLDFVLRSMVHSDIQQAVSKVSGDLNARIQQLEQQNQMMNAWLVRRTETILHLRRKISTLTRALSAPAGSQPIITTTHQSDSRDSSPPLNRKTSSKHSLSQQPNQDHDPLLSSVLTLNLSPHPPPPSAVTHHRPTINNHVGDHSAPAQSNRQRSFTLPIGRAPCSHGSGSCKSCGSGSGNTSPTKSDHSIKMSLIRDSISDGDNSQHGGLHSPPPLLVLPPSQMDSNEQQEDNNDRRKSMSSIPSISVSDMTASGGLLSLAAAGLAHAASEKDHLDSSHDAIMSRNNSSASLKPLVMMSFAWENELNFVHSQVTRLWHQPFLQKFGVSDSLETPDAKSAVLSSLLMFDMEALQRANDFMEASAFLDRVNHDVKASCHDPKHSEGKSNSAMRAKKQQQLDSLFHEFISKESQFRKERAAINLKAIASAVKLKAVQDAIAENNQNKHQNPDLSDVLKRMEERRQKSLEKWNKRKEEIISQREALLTKIIKVHRELTEPEPEEPPLQTQPVHFNHRPSISVTPSSTPPTVTTAAPPVDRPLTSSNSFPPHPGLLHATNSVLTFLQPTPPRSPHTPSPRDFHMHRNSLSLHVQDVGTTLSTSPRASPIMFDHVESHHQQLGGESLTIPPALGGTGGSQQRPRTRDRSLSTPSPFKAGPRSRAGSICKVHPTDF